MARRQPAGAPAAIVVAWVGASFPPMNRLIADVARGAGAGLVATMPMSAFMLAAQALGHTGRLPPAKITDAALDAVDAAPSRPTRKGLATLFHFAFGGACGAVYALFDRQPATMRRRMARGVAFGTAVWALSYAGWVPALGIMPPPQRDRPRRPTTMVLAHWIYGASLALVR